MNFTKTIISCSDCKYKDHSGAFTKGGAKPVCAGPNILDIIAKFKDNIIEPYHWKWRVLKGNDRPPVWCPLKNGESYF